MSKYIIASLIVLNCWWAGAWFRQRELAIEYKAGQDQALKQLFEEIDKRYKTPVKMAERMCYEALPR